VVVVVVEVERVDVVVAEVVVLVVVVDVASSQTAAPDTAAPDAGGQMMAPRTAESAIHFTRRSHRRDATPTGWLLRGAEW
jgi:hypothetical protein